MSIPDVAASSLQGVNLGAAAAAAGVAQHADGGGGGLVSIASPLLLATEAPGNASTATGLFGIAALVIALGAG